MNLLSDTCVWHVISHVSATHTHTTFRTVTHGLTQDRLLLRTTVLLVLILFRNLDIPLTYMVSDTECDLWTGLFACYFSKYIHIYFIYWSKYVRIFPENRFFAVYTVFSFSMFGFLKPRTHTSVCDMVDRVFGLRETIPPSSKTIPFSTLTVGECV